MDGSIVSVSKLNNGVRHNHLTSLFQSLDNVLNDKSKYYQDKVQSLLSVWQQLVSFSISDASKEFPQEDFDRLFLSTLRFVLRADWPKISAAVKTHFTVTLQRLISDLKKYGTYHRILDHCKILESIVKDPWGQPVLSKILGPQNVDLSDYEAYFNLENPKVVVVRLEMLLLSKCEDIAINLCKACLNAYSKLERALEFNQDEIDYITDIYFCSLLKNKKKPELIAEIKKYPLGEGLGLLQRYRADSVGTNYNEHCKTARVWKCNDKLIELLSNTLLANAVLHEELLDSQSQLEALVQEWAAVQTIDGELSPDALKMIRKFVLIAQSSTCIYPFCSFLIRNGNCKEQDFTMVAKCLIRAINQNMNEVEQHRANRERDKLKETYGQLSKGFLLLSDLLNECENIYKECLLTSFSLTPSRECLQIIEVFVTKLTTVTDPQSQQEEKQTDEPEQSIDLTCVKLEESTSDVEATVSSKITSEQPESSAMTSNEIIDAPKLPSKTTSDSLNEILESMGVPEKDDKQICEELDSKQMTKQIDCENDPALAYVTELEGLRLFDEATAVDLSIILSYKRYHTLTWDLNWSKLKENCEKYLEDFEKIHFDDVQLKYLDLDYNQFKDQPINNEDLYGIEKGYEHYAYSPSGSEELSPTKRSGRSGMSSIESDEDVLLIHRKRKKFISSDSDEPKNKRKRTRKSKPKSDDVKRRDSQKSDTGSVEGDDKVRNTIESVISGSDSVNSLRELRSFRITSLKYTNDNPEECDTVSAEQEQLNNYLADSYKSLEEMDLTPLSPRFNVYDVILDHTLVPSDSEIRLPKCEDLTFNSENTFKSNCTAVIKETEEKPRQSNVSEGKNSVPHKKKPKVPKLKISILQPNDSYLNYSSGPVLLSNDEVFKKKYGSKQKPDKKVVENHNTNNITAPVQKSIENLNTNNAAAAVQKSIENHNTNNAAAAVQKSIENHNTNNTAARVQKLTIQLPKLSEPFNSKKSVAVKPIDSKTSFTSYLESKITDASSGDNIEDIQNFINKPESSKYTPVHDTNSSHRYQQPTTVENTCQTDFEMPYVGLPGYNFMDLEQVLNSPSSTRSTPDFNSLKVSSVQLNIPRVIPNASSLVSAPSTVKSQPNNTAPSYTCTTLNNGIILKRTNADKVDEILHNYQTAITENPALKNIPAPRKRGSSTNASKKPRSRTKNDSQSAKLIKTSKLNGYTGPVENNLSEFTPSSVPHTLPANVPCTNGISPRFQTPPTNVSYTNSISPVSQTPPANSSYRKGIFYDESSSKLPPIDASSQVIACTAKQPQYRYNVPTCDNSKPVPYSIVNSVKVSINAIEKPAKLKTLLLQGTSPSNTSSTTINRHTFPVGDHTSYAMQHTNSHQQNNPPVTQLNNCGHVNSNLGQQVSLSTTQINNSQQEMTRLHNLGQQISSQETGMNNHCQQITSQGIEVNNHCHQISISTNQMKNYVLQVQQNDSRLNAVSANSSYNSFNSSSQSQKATQYLEEYKGVTNDFAVRIPRIDCAVNNVPYSYLNRTINDTRNASTRVNVSAARINMNPSVVIQKLPITAVSSMRNDTIVNVNGNYQMNNFNVTTTASLPATSMQNVHVNINSSIPVNNSINNINSQFLPQVVIPDIQHMKNQFNFNIDSDNVISIANDHAYSEFEKYLSNLG